MNQAKLQLQKERKQVTPKKTKKYKRVATVSKAYKNLYLVASKTSPTTAGSNPLYKLLSSLTKVIMIIYCGKIGRKQAAASSHHLDCRNGENW